MSSPITAAGAQSSPTRYAALTQQARELTGLVTHRSPYRDGAVPYQVEKYYGGTRYDTILDGLNREVSNILTGRRRPGSAIFNANTFPAINSFYSWSFIQDAAEIVRTIVDGRDGVIYDATPGQKTALYSKSAGASLARFQSVNTQLFFGDGVETKKIMRSAKSWKPGTSYSPRDLIIDPNGNIQRVRANPVTYNIASIKNTGIFAIITLTGPAPKMPSNQTLTFAGITHDDPFAPINNTTQIWQPITQAALQQLALGPNQIAFLLGSGIPYADTASAGTMIALTATPGISGGSQPAWSNVVGTVTNDGGTNGGVNWTCFGSAVENWGIDPIAYANDSYLGGPLTYDDPGSSAMEFWEPNKLYTDTQAGSLKLLDSNGNIQILFGVVTAPQGNTGLKPPSWAPNIGDVTTDGGVYWQNYGQAASWYSLTNYGGASNGVANPCIVLDPNGNLQYTQDITTANASGAAAPAWATGIGTPTVDGAVTWVCIGPGAVLWTGQYRYSFSFHCIDGSVSTAAPATLIASGGIGAISGAFGLQLHGPNTTDKQCDEIWIWRTAQGQPDLLFVDSIPNPAIGTAANWTYHDVADDGDLTAQIPAPIAERNSPPDPTMTGPIYHLQRIWAIGQNKVVWSGGPDVITGNGNTSFAPLNYFAYPGRPIALRPVTVENGGILVLTTKGTYIILGTGTPANPFYSTDYYNKVSLLGPNAIELYNNRLFLMESNGKVSSLAVEYPFSPQTGYSEIGFPIGDQFKKVTTGGISAPLYDPATTFLSWNVQDTDETGMYVADGAVGWFRMGLMMPPEQEGYNWSTRAAIAAGTSAVQAIETTPGRSQLLIGPYSSGPILCRDETVSTDNGAAYPAWDVKGVILLCSTGQWAEIAHVATKSKAVGTRPTLSILMGEIAVSAERPWDVLELEGKTNDPPLQRASKSAFSDRYVTAQNGETPTGDCVMIRFDYGTQNAADELLDWGIYATVQNERAEEAAKVGA